MNPAVFNVSPKEAVEIQKALRDQVKPSPLKKGIKIIAGADVSFNKFEKDVYAGIILFSFPDFVPLEYACVREEVSFPYIPGLLSFREIPPLLKAWQMLHTRPDVVVVDGHGIAHPRRLGIAAHFSLAANVPALGCAKKILYGKTGMPSLERGSFLPIIDPKTEETIGVTLRTKQSVAPVFVSPGNGISLDEAKNIILESAKGYRLPEPTRLAHNLVNEFRRGELPDRSCNHKIFKR